MSDIYPVILDSETRGTLQVTKLDLTTEFRARCADPGRLVRLSVFGDGKEGYLGVMEPECGELRLCRKLSRTAMAGFPETIAYASEAASGYALRTGLPAASAPTASRRTGEKNRREILWRQVGDGSLCTVIGGKTFRAYPMANWGFPLERAVERRVIEGVEYAVFAIDDGG